MNGLIVTFVLGMFLLIGVLGVKLVKNNHMIEQLSIAIALGAMLSLVGAELIPEVCETFGLKGAWVIVVSAMVGVLILKLLDRFVPEHDHDHKTQHESTAENVIHIGTVSAVAIILHNMIEGMAVYSMTMENLKVGMLVAFGVGLHNIPMGMLIYSTLEKERKEKKILILILAVLSTFAGGALMALISPVLSEFVIGILICITLGMLLYIILFELIPYLLHSGHKVRSAMGIVVGVLVVLISHFLE